MGNFGSKIPTWRGHFFVPLKLGTRVGHEKLNFAIFEFYDFAKKIGEKSDSSLKSRKKFTKDFHVKKNIHRNPL